MHTIQHIHFIGIGGIGMSGIAKILKSQGYTISGCDQSTQNVNIQALLKQGCTISASHNSDICHDQSIDVVVYSSAITYDHPELRYAREHNIPTIQRATMLAELMKTKFSIGIAGSHGKTTTSAMLSHILLQAQIDPTIIIGGNLATIGSNAHYGKSKFLVAETDESDRSLLQLPTSVAVLTNIDFEHPDQYKNLEDVTQTFHTFLQKLPFYGKAIVCLDDPVAAKLIPDINATTISYGTTHQADIEASSLTFYPDYTTCTIKNNTTKEIFKQVTIPMPGKHNVLNALGAITAASTVGVSLQEAATHIETFPGVDRRFTFKGTNQQNVAIFDDYGHHPTEIYHTLQIARKKATQNLVVVFQPQRYTRTKYLWKQFVDILTTSQEDHLIITDIYAASENPLDGICAKKLVADIQKQAPEKKIYYCSSNDDFQEIQTQLTHILQENALLLFLGAGKVNQLVSKLL